MPCPRISKITKGNTSTPLLNSIFKPITDQQLTQGYNIVTDGWAWASNPINTPHPHLQTYNKASKTLIFSFWTCAHGPIDPQMDKATKNTQS